ERAVRAHPALIDGCRIDQLLQRGCDKDGERIGGHGVRISERRSRGSGQNGRMTPRRAWVTGLVCVAGFLVLALVVGLAPAAIDPLDAAWNSTMATVRSDAVVQAALVLNTVGGGWMATVVVPILLAALAWLLRGWRAAVLTLGALGASAA